MEQSKEKCFEDAFMEILSDYISLCLEATDGAVDVIYGYIYQDPGELSCNAFFRKDGEICYLNTFLDRATLREFFSAGMEDIRNLVSVCNAYGQKCPHEIKMIYQVQTKKFDAHFGYEDNDPETFLSTESFMNWIQEEKAKTN